MSNVITDLRAILRPQQSATEVGRVTAVSGTVVSVSTASGVIQSTSGALSYGVGDLVLVGAGTIVGKIETEATAVWID